VQETITTVTERQEIRQKYADQSASTSAEYQSIIARAESLLQNPESTDEELNALKNDLSNLEATQLEELIKNVIDFFPNP